jgi:phosphatidylglycerol:prolipoprotein diacylglycerol transferase
VSLGTVFTDLGYFVGALIFVYFARRDGRLDRRLVWVMLCGFAAGVFGARLVQWLLLGAPGGIAAWANPAQGGRTIIAGIVSGWIAVEVAKARLGIKRSTGDLFALGLPAGEAVGRIGCWLNGCCYGAACDLPWAIEQHGALRHTAQLYSSAAALLIFGTLLLLRGKMWRDGDLFRGYLLLYGLTRFGIEFLRERDHLFAGLSLAQWFCLELAIAGAIGLTHSWWVARAKPAYNPPHA